MALYAIGAHFGIEEEIESLVMHAEKRGYPWPVATTSFQTLADFNITRHSTTVALDSDGVITYRGEMGQGDEEKWWQVFKELAVIEVENQLSSLP